jgi:hypothetical protein
MDKKKLSEKEKKQLADKMNSAGAGKVMSMDDYKKLKKKGQPSSSSK